jgi:hypothetical protein
MNPLQLRKQLLLAESELNRIQLAADITTLRLGVRSLAHRVKSVSGIIASAGVVVMALADFVRGKKSAASAGKSSWLQTLLRSAGLISTIFMAFRSSRSPDKSET